MKTVVLFGFVLGALSAAGKVIVTKPGESVTLECGVSSYKSNVEWQRENSLIISQPTRGFPRKGTTDIAQRSRLRQTSLTINGVKEEDAGKFTSVVDGTSQDVTLVVFSVSARPSAELQVGDEATLQCRVGGLGPDFAVQWKRPGERVEKRSEVELKSVARSDAGTWECTFSHNDRTYSEGLEIKVHERPTTPAPTPVPRAPNQNSKDDQRRICSTCDTQTPTKAGALLGLSWWMWVVVGVGCLVVVLLLVAVICLYKRIKRKKRKLQKMKNSRLPLTTNLYCQCNRPTAAAKPQQGRRREKPSAPPLQLLME